MPSLVLSGDLLSGIGLAISGGVMLIGLALLWRDRKRSPLAHPHVWGIALFAGGAFVGAAGHLLISAGTSNSPQLMTWMQLALMGAGASLTLWSSFVAAGRAKHARQRQPFGPSVATPYTEGSNEDEARP